MSRQELKESILLIINTIWENNDTIHFIKLLIEKTNIDDAQMIAILNLLIETIKELKWLQWQESILDQLKKIQQDELTDRQTEWLNIWYLLDTI